ncbi:class I glutamine amidotransferase-like protein [Thelonectria olida]|uniref:Class I glutamine amidotransferase-like protein n=1 Tax=Thelonectria olida TaxID=1576542 RepID=A0A9P9ANP5_9HYPO|nr:class I glutamine amidotransferase-like protein [Thelonectria olida]
MATVFHLAILETDTTPTSISDVEGTYADIVEKFVRCGLDQAEKPIPEVRITKWNVVEGQSYPDLAEVDAIFLTAGRYSAYDDYPWAFRLMGLIQKAYEKEIPMLAICYGHQILARALGGKVTINPKGSELSVTSIDLTPQGADLFGVKSLNVHQMHLDAVVELPPGMDIIGSSSRCDVQLLYQKGRVFGIQGHPEANSFVIKESLKARLCQNLIDSDTYHDAMSQADRVHDGKLFSRVVPRFLFDDC